MDKKTKQYLMLITYAIVLFTAIMNMGHIYAFVKNLIGLLSPVVVGLVVAFILNVPMSGFEKLIDKLAHKINKNRIPPQSAITCISFLLTLVSVALVITLVVTMLVPEIVSSVESIYKQVLEKWPEWSEELKGYGVDTAKVTAWLESFDIENLVSTVSSSAGSLVSSIAAFAAKAFSGISNFIISLVIACYALLSKRQLSKQTNSIMSAYMKKSTVERIHGVGKLVNDTYSKFLSGQCLEACILGVMVFVVFTILGIPYASLTAVLAAVFAFVPYIGSFFACFIGAFLVLLAEPEKVILCIIVYVVVQFIENQFIYPHVVGTSVGLGAFWTLLAVVLGGQIMGVLGMVFFIPLTSVIVTLLRGHMAKRRALKQAEGIGSVETDPPKTE
ncbi:MAG: AI-2E family transporter [Clostridia bacterium]|nr:AI-2E family transporter [Clostridia bacterium]